METSVVAAAAALDVDGVVQLEQGDVLLINNEVEQGDHATFDDALHYIIERGIAEIARTRASQAKAKVQREAMTQLRDMLAKNPASLSELPASLQAAIKAAGIMK